MLENENNFVFENSRKKNHTQKCFPYPHEHFWGIKQSMWNFKKSKTTDIIDHHTTKGEKITIFFFLTLMLNEGEIQIFNRKQNPLTSYISESFFFFNYQNQKAS